MKKDIVAGLGEIGSPILKLLSKKQTVVGYDLDKRLVNETKLKKLQDIQTSFLHIAIPVTSKFDSNLLQLYKKFKPECIVIHSTIGPGTTERIQKKMDVPLIYSATRGVHKRMLEDLKMYVKFFAIEDSAPKREFAINEFSSLLTKCGIKAKQVSSPVTLELSKLVCDTSYYGWLINYAQVSKMISDKYNVDYDEMWTFADEIHKNLGNRPKMFPGFIGGHCVIPNLKLVEDESLSQINEINEIFKKFLESIK